MKYIINNSKFFFYFINLLVTSILIYKVFFYFDFTDESQKIIKLYYLVTEDRLFKYDYNLHQFYFLIIYPFIKLFYFIFGDLFINNFIYWNKFFYLLCYISLLYHIFYLLKKNLSFNNSLTFVISSIPFIYISKEIFFFTYDSILSSIFFYFFILTILNKLNLFKAVIITIISGIAHPVFGIYFFLLFAYEFYNSKRIFKFFFLITLISLMIISIVLYLNIISFDEFLISLKQSSKMSNFLIFHKHKQLLLLGSIISTLILIRLSNYIKIKTLLINNFNLLELLILFITILTLFSKYNIYVTGLFLIQLYFFSFYSNPNFIKNKIQLIYGYGILAIVILSIVSGNSLTKISIIAIPMITSAIISILDSKQLKLLVFLFFIFIFALVQSIFFQYREGTIFQSKQLIDTRFGDVMVSDDKAELFNEIQKKLKSKNINSLTVIGSAPWVYLTGDYKPITKNLFFDIEENLFFQYLNILDSQNFIVLQKNKEINTYIKNLLCERYQHQIDIPNINKILDRDYSQDYLFCKKNEK